MQHEENFYQRLVRVIDGQASPEEAAEVEIWMRAEPANKELFFKVKDILDRDRANRAQTDTAGAWEQVSGKITRVKKMQWWKYAAVFALLVLAGGAAIWLGVSRQQGAEVAYQAPAGGKTEMTVLPDGSKVWLQPGSGITYQHRQATVTGSAFFEVAPAETPFTARSGEISVQVLGTSFTLHPHAVIVSTGKIKAVAGEHEMVVSPGEKVTLRGGSWFKQKVNAQLYAAWKDGDYLFNNTSLAELQDVIASSYGLTTEIRNPDFFRGAALSGQMQINDVETLKTILAVTLNAHVSQHDQTLIIQPK
ncbi:DUF4974 domain-containing protein [Chitinophaga lutea]|uniref:DUF4974 domain-containing protein n=1 Tax=Chitinophaga lutea TaxID=2488634 RepID=A0A3N4PNL5_9BACT|nr:FecR domain-containing protein [Chitinophaga lutea]RPE09756.1 DUF4974 domain-containing protein [Chitinophaga lutea]